MNFTGKTAVVTGAASGMGLLFAQSFASLGGNVVLSDVETAIWRSSASPALTGWFWRTDILQKTVGEGHDPPGDFAQQNHSPSGESRIFPFGKSENRSDFRREGHDPPLQTRFYTPGLL